MKKQYVKMAGLLNPAVLGLILRAALPEDALRDFIRDSGIPVRDFRIDSCGARDLSLVIAVGFFSRPVFGLEVVGLLNRETQNYFDFVKTLSVEGLDGFMEDGSVPEREFPCILYSVIRDERDDFAALIKRLILEMEKKAEGT